MDTNLNIKKYNLMNFGLPYGFNVTLGFNGFNLVLGFMTQAEFAMVSGVLGLAMNLILFLTKTFILLYKELRNNGNGKASDEVEPFPRTCPNCKDVYETTSVTQVFCSSECREIFSADAYSRRP